MFTSNTTVSATFPAAHAQTISLIGIPASASATDAASNAAHLEPPSACKISINTSTAVLGNWSKITAGSNASLITLEIVVVSCENPDGLLKAKKAIQMIEEQAHIANLTDRIKSMLESNGE